jgi:hypothetical protein
MTVVFKIIRGVGGGTGCCSSSAFFRGLGWAARLASEATTTSRVNAARSGQTGVEALLLFFKQDPPGRRTRAPSVLFHRQTGK